MPLGAARYLLDAVPVADHQSVEPEPLLQHVADQMGVAVHLAPALAGRGIGEARIADHDGLNIGFQRAVIAGGMGALEVASLVRVSPWSLPCHVPPSPR